MKVNVNSPDGKILAAGGVGFYDFGLVRFNADGSLDSGFGSGGMVQTDLSSGSFDWAYSMALQPDGKIILAGQSNQNFALVRYTSTGALDNTFGSGGIVIQDMGGDDIAYSVVLQQDGKIVVGGKNSYDFAMARYNTNGTLDSGFGSSGKAFCNLYPSGNHNVAYELAIGRDGRIVIAGESDDEVGLARYHGQKLRYYPLQDANHNVTSLLDGSGAVLERYVYDPYGAVTVLNGVADLDQVVEWTIDGQGISDVGWRYLYQGGFFDYATWMYHFRNREYSPVLGRWVQPDPIVYGDGMNVYQGFGSNPVRFVDPMGLQQQLPSGGPFLQGGSYILLHPAFFRRPGGFSLNPRAEEMQRLGLGWAMVIPDRFGNGTILGTGSRGWFVCDQGSYRYNLVLQRAAILDPETQSTYYAALYIVTGPRPTALSDSYREYLSAVQGLHAALSEVVDLAASLVGVDLPIALATGQTVSGRDLATSEKVTMLGPSALRALGKAGKFAKLRLLGTLSKKSGATENCFVEGTPVLIVDESDEAALVDAAPVGEQGEPEEPWKSRLGLGLALAVVGGAGWYASRQAERRRRKQARTHTGGGFSDDGYAPERPLLGQC